MSRIILTIAATILLAALVRAQEPAGPPKEMARFDRILGNWTGSGASRMSPEGPESPWTAHTTARKVLGGHYVREEALIAIKGPMPMNLAFVTFYAWDAEQGRYMVYSIGNAGELNVTELEWTDENTMVQHSVMYRTGKRALERWITKINGETVTLEGSTAGATGGLWVMVKGKMKRSKDAKAVDLGSIGALATMKPPAEMNRLARMAGNYTIKGSWSMAAGQKHTPFVGTERARSIFGGMVVESYSAGEGYEGYSASIWNARRKRYVRLALSSWGIHHTTTGFWANDHQIVYTFNGELMGQTMVTRSVMGVGDSGRVIRGDGHTIGGTADPFKSFEATYAVK